MRPLRAWALATNVVLASTTGIALTSCGSLRTIVASPHDYDDYKRFRYAENVGEKLSAGWIYLRTHPRGAFFEEVSAWFHPTEARFYAAAGRTAGGAQAYLDLMPDGPHAEEERTFLRAIEIEKREAPLRAQRAIEAAQKKATAARRALGEAVELWAKRAAKVDTYGQPRAALKGSAFSTPYEADPYPICDEEGCSKFVPFTYAVPDAETPADRTVILEIRVEITAGVLTAITLVLPQHGFNWWLEGSEGKGIEPIEQHTRNEANLRARNRIESVVREVRGDGCATTEADEGRILACGDLRIAIGTRPSGDDIVRFVSVKP